jgi:hypothetical protein
MWAAAVELVLVQSYQMGSPLQKSESRMACEPVVHFPGWVDVGLAEGGFRTETASDQKSPVVNSDHKLPVTDSHMELVDVELVEASFHMELVDVELVEASFHMELVDVELVEASFHMELVDVELVEASFHMELVDAEPAAGSQSQKELAADSVESVEILLDYECG